MYQTALNIQANVESSQTDRHTPPNNVNNDSSLSSISPNSCSSNSSRNSPAIPVQNQSTPMVYSSQSQAQYHQYYPQPTNYYQQYSNYYYSQYNYDYSRYQQQQQVQKLMNDSASFNSRNSSNLSMNDSQQSPTVETKPKAFLSFSIERILAPSSNVKPVTVAPISQQEESRKRKKSVKASNAVNNKDMNQNKRIRTIFTQEQLDKLEVEFHRQQYMVGSERTYLAEKLGLSESQVKIWFQNRRIKWRKSQQSSNGTERAQVDEEDDHQNNVESDDEDSYSYDGSNCDE